MILINKGQHLVDGSGKRKAGRAGYGCALFRAERASIGFVSSSEGWQRVALMYGNVRESAIRQCDSIVSPRLGREKSGIIPAVGKENNKLIRWL